MCFFCIFRLEKHNSDGKNKIFQVSAQMLNTHFFYTMVDLDTGRMIDMSRRDTISDILYVLRDGKCHTYKEIAYEVETSLSTVRRIIRISSCILCA